MPKNPYMKNKKTASTRYVDRKSGEEFNPLNFKTNRSGTRSVSASERIWNEQGEFNAGSKDELVHKLASMLKDFEQGNHDVTTAEEFNKTASFEREAQLQEAMSTSEGFAMVGQSLINPIKEVLDYEGLARKVLVPRTVKQGEIPRYDKDVFATAWIIAEDGTTPESFIEGTYVYPTEFEVTCRPTIPLRDKMRAQYDILARIQDKAKQDVLHKEDTALMNLLKTGAAAENTTTLFTSVNLATLESLRYQVERHRLILDKYIMNRQETSDLITVLSQQVDPVTQRELFMQGYIGNILNAKVVTTAGTNTYEILDPGEILAVTDAEHLGGMPVRQELMSEPLNEFVLGNAVQGWFFYELISQVLVNAAGVAYGQAV